MERRRSRQPDPSPLQPVSLQELRLLPDGRHWTVDQFLSDLDSLTPVRGRLSALHGATVLEVEGEGTTFVTLRCDRCLQPYDQKLLFRCRELLWLGEPEGFRLDGEDDGLADRLDPRGSFDPARWMFEQLSLQLPLQNCCGDDCPGPDLPLSPAPLAPPGPETDPPSDPRWAGLRQLR